MRKESNVYLLDNMMFIHSKIGTQSVPAFSEPLFDLDMNQTSAVEIGNRLRKCLESFQPGNERYDREKWKTVNDPLIKRSGEKNSKSFFKKVKYVPVNVISDTIRIHPSVNAGKDGFKQTEHSSIELDYSTATDEDLGNALLKAFELSSII